MESLALWLSSRRFMLVVRASAVGLSVVLATLAGVWLLAGTPAHRGAPGTASAVVDALADQKLVRQADLGAPAPPPVSQVPPAPSGAQGTPGELRVPSLSIRGLVYPVGVDKNNTMEVTENAFTVGWYKNGPLPGAGGDAVETCHNEWYTAPRALCYYLHNVAVGADIYTTNPDGTQHHWKVTSVRTVAFDASVPGLFDVTGPPRLSIITCGGTWLPKQQIFTQRVIVDASLADSA